MIKEAFGTGSSVEEAQENALRELGADFSEDVQIEVIDTPKKKVLGMFGGSPAKVRAYIEIADAPKKDNNSKARQDGKPAKKAEPKNEAAKKENEAVEAAEPLNMIDAEELDHNSKSYKAYSYLKEVIKKLGCGEVKFTAAEIENGVHISLEGDDLGVVIGRRGETLDSLQYLASLAANGRDGKYYRVVLNIGDYREKREQTLRGLAKRTASQVLRTHRNRTLEPMNPYERRIIHTTIQGINGVTSSSVGEGTGRRVVISTESGSRGGRGYRDNNRTDRRPSQPAPKVDPNRHKKVDVDSIPLYGKLN